MNAILKPLIWLDRVVNVILGGNSRETLSSRAHRMDVKNHPYWGWTAGAINKLFFWQTDHCKAQWEYEQANPFADALLPVDKLLHFGAGMGIALLFGFAVFPWFGLAAAAFVGLLKEVYDHFDPFSHTVDLWDWLVTCFGGYAGAALLIYA